MWPDRSIHRAPEAADPVAPAAHDPLGITLRRYLLTGDEEAIEAVVAATRPRLMAAARRIAGADEAEDAVQTAYLSLVRHRGAPLDAPVLPWLLTAVVRTAYRKKAAARRELRLADRLAISADAGLVPAPAHDAEGEETRARLRGAVARLPARYRDAVVLHDLHGLSTAEVARLLDVTEAGVRTRLRRARALVRLRLVPRIVAGALWFPFWLGERTHDGTAVTALTLGGAMKAPVALSIALVALFAGTAVGRLVLAPPVAPVEERAQEAEARNRELEAQLARVSSERDAALGQRSKDPAALAAATPKPPKPAPTAPTPEPAGMETGSKPAEPAKPRFVVEGFEKLGDGIDWKAVGTNLTTMAPLMGQFADEWAKTGKVPTGLAMKLNEYNAPLVTAAVQAAERLGLELRAANTAFTHPAFQVNAIAAALDAAKLPLTEAQAQALGRIAGQFASEDSQRLKSYDDRAWALQKLIDESTLRDRFFEAAFAQLTQEQRDALVLPAMKGRLQGDLFSAGLVWLAHAQVLPFPDREGLVATLEKRAVAHFDVPDDKKAAVHDAVVEWGNGLPPEVVGTPADALSLNGMVPVERVLDAARRQLALLQRVIDSARLDEAQAKKVKEDTLVLVPLRTK